MDELLTSNEVLTVLKISRSKLEDLINSGQLQAHRIGENGSLRFKRNDVTSVLQPRTPSPLQRQNSLIGRSHGPGVPMKFG